MDDDKKFLRDFLAKASQPVNMDSEYRGRAEDSPYWRLEHFRENLQKHGISSEDEIEIFKGVSFHGSMSVPLIHLKIEKAGAVPLFAEISDDVIREFGGVM